MSVSPAVGVDKEQIYQWVKDLLSSETEIRETALAELSRKREVGITFNVKAIIRVYLNCEGGVLFSVVNCTSP